MYQLTIVLLVFGLATAVHFLVRANEHLGREQRKNAYAWRHFRRLQGSTMLWPGSSGEVVPYDLRSWDSGTTWFAVETDAEIRMTIKGPAEQIFPGLLAVVVASGELASARGALDLSNDHDLDLLQRAGFTVQASNT